MHKVNQFAFYKFGAALRDLDDIKAGDTFLQFSMPFINASMALRTFIDENSHVSLPLSKAAAQTLINSITATMDSFIPPGKEIDWDRKLDEGQVRTIIGKRTEFETIFEHESRDIDVYAVTPKGIYSTPALIERAENALPADVKSRLSAETVYDIQQAGRCLAFNISTAAGFHILKAVESMIREYHLRLTGKHISAKSRNWGAYIRDLNNHGADTKVTTYLSHIKDFYRNPIVHPEVTLTSEQALSLFSAAVSAIVQLDAAIQSLKPPSSVPASP
jgi:hypothetical protein